MDGVKGDDPLTVTSVEATVTVKDVNDEPPSFNKREYYVEISENIVEGSPLPNLNMSVRDPDVVSNGTFKFIFRGEIDFFLFKKKYEIQISSFSRVAIRCFLYP